MAPNELHKKFNLQPTSTEYKDVLKHFQATCPNNKVFKVCVLLYFIYLFFRIRWSTGLNIKL